VDLYVSNIFNTSVQKQFDAFKEGFQKVCGGQVIRLFYAQELQALVSY